MDTTQEIDRCEKLNRLAIRILEAFGSLLGIISSAGVLYVHFTEPAKNGTWREKIASVLSVEFFIALFIASCCIFVEAVAAPKWLEKITAKRASMALCLLLLWIVASLLLGVS